jgi:hypothetical protein
VCRALLAEASLPLSWLLLPLDAGLGCPAAVMLLLHCCGDGEPAGWVCCSRCPDLRPVTGVLCE